MAHPLKGKLSIDVDDQIGLGNIHLPDGTPILGAFFEPVGFGGDAPRGNAATLVAWRNLGGGRLAGLRFVPHSWSKFKDAQGNLVPGDSAAKICSDYITKVEADAKARVVDAVEWDIETHDTTWQRHFLVGKSAFEAGGPTKGIRGAGGFLPDPTKPETLGFRWGRPGVFTMEGRQDATTSEAALAAATGLLVGPQCYDGAMTEIWDLWFEIETWVRNSNPQRRAGARIPITSILPYYDARKSLMPVGANESVLFATSRLV